MLTGTFQKGKRHRHWIEQYYSHDEEKGYKTEKGPYVNDKKHGDWVGYHPNGSVEYEGAYVDGKKHGHWVERYPDGSVSSEGSYVAGEKQGKWVYQGNEEYVFSETFYVAGKHHGKWVTRLADGTVVETTFVHDEPQVRVTRFADGIVGGGSYKDGRMHGAWIEGYLARDKSKGRFVDGQKVGVWFRFYEGDCSITTYGDVISSRTEDIEKCREVGLIP